MKYIKKYNESTSNDEIENFLKLNRIENYRINDDQTIDTSGDLILRTGDIPKGFKIGNVGGVFKIMIDIYDFSFFPDTAKKWVINIPVSKYTNMKQSSPFWAKYSDLVEWEDKNYSDFMGIYGIDVERSKMLSDYYIEMASNGGLLKKYSNELEVNIWEDAKGEYFSNTEVKIEDYPPFASYEDVDFKKLIEEAKSVNFEKACNLLIGIILNDDGFYKSKFDEVYLGNVYNDIKSYNRLFSDAKKLSQFRSVINMNLQKTPETIKRDEEENCYVFIARKGFIENEDGTYNKSIDIENMYLIDIYDPKSYETINMMKFRFNSESQLYMIWLPKDFFHSEANRIRPNKHQLEIIDKYKKRI